MRILVALGGNALLRRGERPDADLQQINVLTAAKAIAEIAGEHEVVLTHGNGPQVGMLALESAADPTKFVGPVYTEEQATARAAEHGWTIRHDGSAWRRVVPSPRPQRVVETRVIRALVESGTIVVCAGGGGVPAVRDEQTGRLRGVEAVVDKDQTAALLAEALDADALLLLTDVPAGMTGYGTPHAALIRHTTPALLRSQDFAAGSMGSKVDAACRFVELTGNTAAIGALDSPAALLRGAEGTIITPGGLASPTSS